MDYVLSQSFSPSSMPIHIIKQNGSVVMSEGVVLFHAHKQNFSGCNIQSVSMRLKSHFLHNKDPKNLSKHTTNLILSVLHHYELINVLSAKY